jgi:hypothetical protein
MNHYSIIAHAAAKYSLGALSVAAFMGGCFLSYGFGMLRGERRMYNEINRSLDVVKTGIELVVDQKRWKEEINKELHGQAAISDSQRHCAHPH